MCYKIDNFKHRLDLLGFYKIMRVGSYSYNFFLQESNKNDNVCMSQLGSLGYEDRLRDMVNIEIQK